MNDNDVVPMTTDSPINEFPVEVLPQLMRKTVVDVSTSQVLPAATVAITAFGLISGAVGATAYTRFNGFKTRPNEFFMLVEKTGIGKSTAFNLMASGLQAYVAKKEREYAMQIPAMRAELAAADLKLKTILKELRAVENEPSRGYERQGLLDDKHELSKQIHLLEKRVRGQQFILGEVTDARAGELIENSPDHHVFFYTPEARRIFDTILGAGKGGGTGEHIYLNLFSGDPMNVATRNGSNVSVNRGYASILWGIQSDKAESMMKSRAMRESGLMPRFLIGGSECPPNPLAFRDNPPVLLEWDSLLIRLFNRRFDGVNEEIGIWNQRGLWNAMAGIHTLGEASMMSQGDLARVVEHGTKIALLLALADESKIIADAHAQAALRVMMWFIDYRKWMLIGEKEQASYDLAYRIYEDFKSSPTRWKMVDNGSDVAMPSCTIASLVKARKGTVAEIMECARAQPTLFDLREGVRTDSKTILLRFSSWPNGDRGFIRG